MFSDPKLIYFTCTRWTQKQSHIFFLPEIIIITQGYQKRLFNFWIEFTNVRIFSSFCKFSVSSTDQHLMISALHLFTMFRKHECQTSMTETHIRTRVDPHGSANSSRSPVASDVFTLVWGDCYFCTEPDSSIIHCRCWRTRFTSLRKGGGCVCFQRAPRVRVYVSIWARTHVWGDLQRKMNCWHATPNSRGGKKHEAKRKRSCHKHGNQRIWSGRWGSKSTRRRGKELVPLSPLYAQPCTLQSSLAQ